MVENPARKADDAPRAQWRRAAAGAPAAAREPQCGGEHEAPVALALHGAPREAQSPPALDFDAGAQRGEFPPLRLGGLQRRDALLDQHLEIAGGSERAAQPFAFRPYVFAFGVREHFLKAGDRRLQPPQPHAHLVNGLRIALADEVFVECEVAQAREADDLEGIRRARALVERRRGGAGGAVRDAVRERVAALSLGERSIAQRAALRDPLGEQHDAVRVAALELELHLAHPFGAAAGADRAAIDRELAPAPR